MRFACEGQSYDTADMQTIEVGSLTVYIGPHGAFVQRIDHDAGVLIRRAEPGEVEHLRRLTGRPELAHLAVPLGGTDAEPEKAEP